MAIEQELERDLKAAMLAGEKTKVETLRTIKSSLQSEAIALGVKDAGLNEEQAQKVLAREAKKRAEAAELYKNAGEQQRADNELAEKNLIETYLPEQMDESAVAAIVKEEIDKLSASSMADMGKVIGAVRARTGGTADGSLIARLVKEQLE